MGVAFLFFIDIVARKEYTKLYQIRRVKYI